VDATRPVARASSEGHGTTQDPVAAPDHEREIASDLVRRALILSPVALGTAAIFAGWPGVVGAAIGMVIVIGNFFMLAKLMASGAKAGAQATGFAAMLSYAVLLLVITVVAVILRDVSFVDLASFVLTVAIAHLALLFLELPRLGLTPGAPGLKPRPLSRTEKKESR
jgi:hypothetical protein